MGSPGLVESWAACSQKATRPGEWSGQCYDEYGDINVDDNDDDDDDGDGLLEYWTRGNSSESKLVLIGFVSAQGSH